LKLGGIIAVIFAIKFFVFDKFVKKTKKYGTKIQIKGSKKLGNDTKLYEFYSDAWAYYDNGIALSVDIDGLLIDRRGRPYRVTSWGIEIDPDQINIDYELNNNRYLRSQSKTIFVEKNVVKGK
jgi:hypothetical protein